MNSRRELTWFAISLTGVVLLLGLASPSVYASCGDYLRLPQRSMAMAGSVDGIAAPLAQHRPSPAHRVPCHGPNCSGQQSQPPMVPLALPGPQPERWGSTTAGLELPTPSPAPFAREIAVAHPIDRSFRIERPPRPLNRA